MRHSSFTNRTDIVTISTGNGDDTVLTNDHCGIQVWLDNITPALSWQWWSTGTQRQYPASNTTEDSAIDSIRQSRQEQIGYRLVVTLRPMSRYVDRK